MLSINSLDYMWLMSYEDQFKAVKRKLTGAKLKSVIHNKWIHKAFFEGEGDNIIMLNIDGELTRRKVRNLARQAGIDAPNRVPSLEWFVSFIHRSTGKRSKDSYSVAYEDIPSIAWSEARALGVPVEELEIVNEWR